METNLEGVSNIEKVFDIKVKTLSGMPFDLNECKGKKVMIVNTASECSFTAQYAPLEELYRKHKDKLVVLACPCNDFGGQEPGTADEIAHFCSRNFEVSFPILEKMQIITANPHPLYSFLINSAKAKGLDSQVEWNFHKFLLDESGELVDSLPANLDPMDAKVLDWVKS